MSSTELSVPRLVVRHRGQDEVVWLSGEPVTGGRAEENRIVIKDPRVSRFHFRVEEEGDGQWVLLDTGSQNGIVHRGRRVKKLRLIPGVKVQIGGATLLYEEEGSVEAAEPDEEAGLGVTQVPAAPAEDRARLTRLAELMRRLCRSPSDEGLARALVEAAVALTGSERGFLLRKGREGMDFVAALGVERNELERPEFQLSWSIAARVGTTGQALRLMDAASDETFSRTESVENLGLRSVLCVPVAGAHGLMGVLYLDSTIAAGVYDAADQTLVEMLSDQAGILWHHLELQRRLRERSEEVEALNAELNERLDVSQRELRALRGGRDGSGEDPFDRLVGTSARMSELKHLLRKVAATDFPVLVTGESGTGKELVARSVHEASDRVRKPFVGLNCAAVPESLQESELFGHVRGAFTGADRDKTGLFQAAHKGTLFLDEVSEMAPSMQARLLRALQEGEVRPVGAKAAVPVDVRVVAASNRDLESEVRKGRFREDLYFRLKVLPVRVPPLRERREDIPELVRHFLDRHLPKDRRLGLDPVALDLLCSYSWPGNVRELENEVKRLCVLAQDVVRRDDLSTALLDAAAMRVGQESSFADLNALVETVEGQEIRKALARTHGNKTRAAECLGISRFALQRKLDKYGIAAEGDPS